MTIEDTRSFIVLAKTLNYTKAAEMLYKSQPSLSRQISQLEGELQVELFKRNSKAVELTLAGEHFLEGIQEINRLYEELVADTHLVQEGYIGELHIGVVKGQSLLKNYSGMLAAFSAKYPDIHLSITAHNPMDLRYKMKNQEIDVAFSILTESRTTPYEYQVAGPIRNAVVVPVTHPMADRDDSRLTLHDFAEDTFILFGEFEHLFGGYSSASRFRAGAIEPEIIYADSLDSLAAMTEAGFGITFGNEGASLFFNPGLKHLYLPELGSFDEAVIWNPLNPKGCIQVFASFVRSYYTE